MKFPKTVFVTEGEDGEEKYLVVSKDIEDIDSAFPEGEVAVYELKGVQQISWSYVSSTLKKRRR